MNRKRDTKITLVDTEVNVVKHIAALRTARSRKAGATNTPFGGRTQEEIDIDTFGAELAFCKMFNYYPDLTTFSRSGGADCLGRDGKKIDVKQSTKRRGGLIVSKHKTIKSADMYCLMSGNMPTYWYEGWAWANEVVRAMNLQLVGNQQITCYVLGHYNLYKGEPGYAKSKVH